ncbi:DUF3372 domain-containing protein [Massilia sp. H-1]|nr:DUF3372 domain-containing protein [Massilia sp. H-1]
MVKVGLAGSARSYPLQTWSGKVSALEAIDYGGGSQLATHERTGRNGQLCREPRQPYPVRHERVQAAVGHQRRGTRVQILGVAINAFSQGVAYFHAGIDTLRSKSLDRNSFNSGDWFNRIDWSYQDNYFGTGLPPEADNGKDYALIKPLLANAALKLRRPPISPSRATRSATCCAFAPAQPCSACAARPTSASACASTTRARSKCRP